MRNVSDKSVETIKAHILCLVTFFQIIAVYELMWKNTAKPGKPPMTA
jgi:hypothetical protein